MAEDQTSASSIETVEQHEARGTTEPCPALWIVVPFRNEAAGIQPTLAALAAQRDRNFTLVLVDNGSTDGSAEVIRRALSASPILRWHLIDEPQKGTGAAADTGFRFAIGAGATHVGSDRRRLPPGPRVDYCDPRRVCVWGGIDRGQDWATSRRGAAVALARPHYCGSSSRAPPGSGVCDRATAIAAISQAISWRQATISPSPPISTSRCGGFPRTSIEETHEDRALVNAARLITPNIAHRNDMLVLNSLRRLRRWGLWHTLLWYWDHRWLPDEVDIR